jgi:hypothetical protein
VEGGGREEGERRREMEKGARRERGKERAGEGDIQNRAQNFSKLGSSLLHLLNQFLLLPLLSPSFLLPFLHFIPSLLPLHPKIARGLLAGVGTHGLPRLLSLFFLLFLIVFVPLVSLRRDLRVNFEFELLEF